MNLGEAMQWLMENRYVILHKGKPKFTTQYYKDMTGIEKGLTSQGVVRENLPTISQAPFDALQMSTYKLTDWSRHYQDFISACQIPAKAVGTHGDQYALNKYSEDGMKAFRTAMLSGLRLDILLATVALYYRSNIRLKKAVGNYMSSGEWRTDYQTLLEQAKNGTLAIHVQNETKKDGGNKYTWG